MGEPDGGEIISVPLAGLLVPSEIVMVSPTMYLDLSVETETTSAGPLAWFTLRFPVADALSELTTVFVAVTVKE